MTRIETIASYIEKGENVIDAGCDQALLSKLLAKKGIYSIASDLRRNIIENAIKSTPYNLEKFITYRVGYGITLTNSEKNYTVVLAGMGTHTILDIIKEYNKPIKKLITVSNNDHYLLRKTMNSLGYIIDKEEIIKEKDKYYNLIILKKGDKKYTLEELTIGVNHQNINLLKERNEYLLNKYEKILTKAKNEELENIVKILKNYTY